MRLDFCFSGHVNYTRQYLQCIYGGAQVMHIPKNAIEFNSIFDSEASCLDFLENIRWPHGFVCPNCQHDDGYRLHCRRLIQCPLCRHQTSVTAGTVFHKTRIPLRVWFYIMFSMSHDKGGASSIRLAAELGMHQTTVWFVMHKLRIAMGRRDELIKLAGFIEMDEAVLGPHARRPSSADREGDDDTDDKKPKKRGPRKLGRKKERKKESGHFQTENPGRCPHVGGKRKESRWHNCNARPGFALCKGLKRGCCSYG